MSDPNTQLTSIDRSTGEIQTLPPQVDYSPAERAAEAEVRALIEARCLMALRRPRNIHQARAKVLEACSRPTFAEQALYRKPVGKRDGVMQYAEGPSIRFAEEAFRALGNLWASVAVRLETSEKRVLQFDLMDLEANNTDSTIITINKTVERSYVKDGQTIISQRMNSNNKVVYTVEATEDDLQVKQAAEIAKRRRDAIMRAFPSDLKEDAIDRIKKTVAQRDTTDPQGALKRILDAFQNDCRVMPDQIEKFLGHTLETISPLEIQALRGIYTAVKEGEATWQDILKSAEEDRAGSIKGAADKATARQASKKAPTGEQNPAQEPPKDQPAPPTPETPLERAKNQAAKTGAQIKKGTDGTLDIPMED